jgi:hypothetical protein
MTSTTPTQPSHNMRVYVDVPTPKDPKQRLLIAELNRSLKLTSNKQLVLNSKEKNASAKVLQPSKQLNQAPKDKKRPREDEKDAKDAPKKRRQVEQAQPLPVKQARVPLSADQEKSISVADPKISFSAADQIEHCGLQTRDRQACSRADHGTSPALWAPTRMVAGFLFQHFDLRHNL